MPWSHRLPDYAALVPEYGQNLVELAAILAKNGRGTPLQVLDVGANVGDSVLQIMHRVPAEVLAVEADPYYLDYLRRNTEGDERVTIAPVLLTTRDDGGQTWTASRRGGTTHFNQSASGHTDGRAVPVVGVADLPASYPRLSEVALIKSDTDGYDTELVPALASTYSSSKPVLFFEYDPRLTESVAGNRADQVWGALAALGYSRVGMWSYAGARLACVSCDEAAVVSRDLLAAPEHDARYLDVAVAHGEDLAGLQALHEMFDMSDAVGR